MFEQSKNFNKHRIADLLVLLLLASLVFIYCVDTVRASTSILNLIFVLPLTVIVLVLCLIQFVVNVPKLQSETDKKEPIMDILPVVGLFAAYVISLHWLGFAVGTSLFLAVFLWLHGERRWPWVIGHSIGIAFALSIFFSKMLPYPMPMLILNSAY